MPGRAPAAPDDARNMARELDEAVAGGTADPGWLQERMGVPAWAAVGVARRLAGGGAIARAMAARPDLVGIVRGPDYLRVVMDGRPWLSVVFREGAGGLHLAGVDWTSCALCSEPERFVRDTLAAAAAGGSAGVLLPGVDLDVSGQVDELGRGGSEWLSALQARNVGAGYLRWLLAGAEVVEVAGRVARVRLRGAEDAWSLRYDGGRWMVDYDELAPGSPLRLAPAAAQRWLQPSEVARRWVEWWLPGAARSGGGLLVSRDLLYAAPRPVQGDVVIYAQDLARRHAMVGLLDASGRRLAAFPAPRLPQRMDPPVAGWTDLFRFSLSADGSLLAVQASASLWVLRPDTGEVAARERLGGGPGALAWSPDGTRLAVGDDRGALRLLDAGRGYAEIASRPGGGGPCRGIAWEPWGLVVLGDGGDLRVLDPASLATTSAWAACCGGGRALAVDRNTGELRVACDGACAPAWLWRALPASADPPELLSDPLYRAGEGTISVDPTGRWMVGPRRAPGPAAELWDLSTGRAVAAFGPDALLRVAWDARGEVLWTVDRGGATRRWSLPVLLESGGAVPGG